MKYIIHEKLNYNTGGWWPKVILYKIRYILIRIIAFKMSIMINIESRPKNMTMSGDIYINNCKVMQCDESCGIQFSEDCNNA